MSGKVAEKQKKIRVEIQYQAKKLFVTHGYDYVKMSEIAKASSISKTTIYYSHFKSKLEIIKSILIEEMELFLNQVKSIAELEGEPEKIAEQILRSWLSVINDDFSLWHLLFSISSNKEIIQEIKESYNSMYSEFLKIGEALFNQMGDTNPGISSQLFMAQLDGIMYQKFFNHNISISDEFISKLIDLWIRSS
jgi:AcrR family transcriptional regulator